MLDGVLTCWTSVSLMEWSCAEAGLIRDIRSGSFEWLLMGKKNFLSRAKANCTQKGEAQASAEAMSSTRAFYFLLLFSRWQFRLHFLHYTTLGLTISIYALADISRRVNVMALWKELCGEFTVPRMAASLVLWRCEGSV